MAKVRYIFLALVTLLGFCSCERDGLDFTLNVGPYGNVPEETRKVMLLYEAGFNSLGGYIGTNIADLQKGYLPGKDRDDDVLLVFSHLTKSSKNYKLETAPAMVRFYSDHGRFRADTLKVWPVGTPVANAAMVTEVFNWVKENFPAAGYGAVMSSHATGWLPKDYYSNASKFEGYNRGSVEYWSPRMRTFGQEYYSLGTETEEINIKDLAAAIPFKLDYIFFDACLMACVEVLWALKDVCDYVVAAPTELPAPGFDYSTLVGYLLQSDTPDFQAACEDFYSRYSKGGAYSYYGSCLMWADCRQMEGLSAVCRTLFDKYRTAIRTLDGRNVQTYDEITSRKGFCVFFDLKDLLREAGASDSELASLQSALDKVVLYEKHTLETTYSPDLLRCCGLSMYLPSFPDYRRDAWHGTEKLDGFYKSNVSWNDATGLVE